MVKRRIRAIVIVAVVLIAVTTMWIMFCGWQWSWGPFSRLHYLKTQSYPGNAEKYDIAQTPVHDNSPLLGQRLCFLGSSVTYGSASMGTSFADYIGRRNDCSFVKEAVPGTTLVDNSADSYVQRMLKLDANDSFELFICQLSTNDASQSKPLGEISSSNNLGDFDTSTVTGAMEYIICYAVNTWDCPVVFYTNPSYDSEAYDQMVSRLLELQDKWDIGVVDFWNDDTFNSISAEERDLYMADSIHPTKAGYLEWWTPVMEEYLFQYIAQEKEALP